MRRLLALLIALPPALAGCHDSVAPAGGALALRLVLEAPDGGPTIRLRTVRATLHTLPQHQPELALAPAAVGSRESEGYTAVATFDEAGEARLAIDVPREVRDRPHFLVVAAADARGDTLFRHGQTIDAERMKRGAPIEAVLEYAGPDAGLAFLTLPGSLNLERQGDTLRIPVAGFDGGEALLPRLFLGYVSRTPAAVTVSDSGTVRAVAATGSSWIVVTSATGVRDSVLVRIGAPPILAASQVSAGNFVSCAVDAAARTFCWGRGDEGALGDGSSTSSATPVIVRFANGTAIQSAQVSVASHACALGTDLLVRCWGNGGNGRLGDGQAFNRNTAASAQLTATLTGVSAGRMHSCAVTSITAADPGVVHCWGRNNAGQIGNSDAPIGADILTPVPVDMPAGVRFVQVSAANDRSCAVDTSGGGWCWGFDGSGQLGRGTPGVSSNVPVRTGGTTTFTQISAGQEHVCAVGTDGRVYCWGFNGNGQLGDGTTDARSLPTAVFESGRRYVSVSAGASHTCAVRTDDLADCWGNGGNGQLGLAADQFPVFQVTPANVTGQTWFSVSAGTTHSCGVSRPARRVYCWGTNDFGQLGTGQVATDGTPVPARSGVPVAVVDPTGQGGLATRR